MPHKNLLFTMLALVMEKLGCKLPDLFRKWRKRSEGLQEEAVEETAGTRCRSRGDQVAPVVFCPKKPMWPRSEEISLTFIFF